MRTIWLPACERHVTLAAYVAAIKTAKAQPTAMFRQGLTTWWPTTGAEIVQQFRRGMHDRITQSIPYRQRGGGKGEA